MGISAIGAYNFVQMQPPPPAKRQTGFVEKRAGIRDHAFWREAVRGVPWRCSTFRDVTNLGALNALTVAEQLMRSYEAMAFTNQLLTWAGIAAPVTDQVVVLDVRPSDIQRCLNVAGGLSVTAGATSFAYVRAEWTLIATEIP